MGDVELLAVLVVSIFVLCCSLLLVTLYARHRGAGLFDPISLFLAFFALFTLPLPINLLFRDLIEDDFGKFTAQEYVPLAVFLCALSLPFFAWAYYSPLAESFAKRLPVPGTPKRCQYFQPFFSFERTRFAALLICGISLWMVMRLAEGNLLQFLLLGYNSTAAMVGKGYLTMGFPWFFVGSLLFLVRYAHVRSRPHPFALPTYAASVSAASIWADRGTGVKEDTAPIKQDASNTAVRSFVNGITLSRAPVARLDLFVFVLLFAAQLLGTFILAQRHTILLMVLAFVIFWHFAIKRISFARISALAVTGFLALTLFGVLRSSNYDSIGAFFESMSHAGSRAQEKGNLTYTLTTGEFVGPFQTMPEIMRKFGSAEIPCRWGSSYLLSPVGFIPQTIYPNRPIALSNWYMSAVYGNGWGQNEGIAFYFLSEGYLNFGPVGVLLAMIAWGFGLGVLNHYRRLNSANSGVILLYSVTLAFVLAECIIGESRTVVSGLPANILGIAAIGLWLSGGLRAASSNN